jgi:chromosome segregation ATPase
VLEAHQEELAK